MKYILFALLAGIITPALSQNRLTGRVTDTENQPLSGATIYLPEISKGTTTDGDGKYHLDNLPNGETRLQVSFVGYTTIIQSLLFQGEPITQNIALQSSVLKTEMIVVTGGYNSTQHENAIKIDVMELDPKEWKATPNFAEILTRVPGVDMISKGSGVAKPVIRGLSMNDILVLNNGVRFENYQYSSHHPLGIDEFGIADVEVIKGPASLLYGSDAIGGVINFIKEKPAAVGTISGDFNSQYFSNSLGFANNLGVKGSSEHIFGGIRAGQKSNADYLQGGGDNVPNSRANEQSLKTHLGITNNVGIFQLFYDYGVQHLGLVEDEAIAEITERGRKLEVMFQQFNTHLLSSQNKLYLGNYKLDMNIGYQHTTLAHLEKRDLYELEMQLATLTYEAKLYLPSDFTSEYIIGFQGMNQRNDNLNNRETILLPNAITNSYSFFGLAQRSFADKLRLQAGMRFDNRQLDSKQVGSHSSDEGFRPVLNKSFNSISGSLGATYNVSDELLFRSNLATGYRTPNLAELTSNGPHELRYEIGNASLTPERSFEADASLHYHIANLSIDAAIFHNHVNDYIFIAPTGNNTTDGLPIYLYRQADARLYGGEAGIHFHPQAIQWLHLESSVAMVRGKQKTSENLPFIPATKWNVEARGEIKDFLFFEDAFLALQMHTAFDQQKPAPDETATTGYTLFDASLGGYVHIANQSLYLSVSASNIFDIKYIDHLSTLKEVGLFNPGRNIAVTLKIPFAI